jgi:rfaE bifunctional protein kinase chain/domain/rfaE bifunctional protein nucleotidyltransferase chain/domain
MDDASKALVAAKIKTAAEIAALIGPRPRTRKVVMCHGTFDIVHPGHIRHLLFAKSRGDVLVAGVTADAHIAKGNLRPYVPQDLRAFNLAALEVVDYVLVDHDPTPLRNIELIKPDYFVKGYEYIKNGIHPKSRQENDLIESYGGEMIFSPGDIVYSSTRLLDMAPPNLSDEKLLFLMNGEGIDFADLRATLDRFNGMRVHVVGDTIIDCYTHCSMIGGMTKTPTMSVRFENRQSFVGGAGIVAKHLRAAGAEVTFSTVMGDDADRDFAVKDLEASGVRTRVIVDPSRPTTNKNCVIAEGYRLLKIDTLDNRSISDGLVAELAGHLRETDADVVVFSDFRHGVFNRHTIPDLVAAIPAGAFRVADSQVASRWGNILEFHGFDLITPNEREARFTLGDQDSVIRPLATALFQAAQCRTLILKLGERGILTHRTRPEGDPRTVIALDSFVHHLVDAVGAGDALLAYATLALVATRNDEAQASILGSIAAALECELDGNIPVTVENMRKRLDRIEAELQYRDAGSAER